MEYFFTSTYIKSEDFEIKNLILFVSEKLYDVCR